MADAISAKIVRIGNSQGIRIPKPVLEQVGIEDEVEMVVEPGEIRIRPKRHPRAGWAEQFAAMAANGDDALLLPDDLTNEFDEEEWEW